MRSRPSPGGTAERVRPALAGTSQSVDYVARQLRKAGYRPRLNTFSFPYFRETQPTVFERVLPSTRTYRSGADFVTMRYSGGGNVNARVVPVDFSSASSGCEDSDFAGFTSGSVALMKRGGCTFTQKARLAEARGAAAALIANDGSPGRTAPLSATLFGSSPIPVMVVSSEVASELASLAQIGPVQVRIVLSVATIIRTSRERDRRPAGAEARGRAPRRAPRLGGERARDQRQRLGLGGRPRDRPAGTPPACSAEARVAVRVLGRRGARAHRVDELRRQPDPGEARADSRRHQPRHGRLAELRPARLRRRGTTAGLGRDRERVPRLLRGSRAARGGGRSRRLLRPCRVREGRNPGRRPLHRRRRGQVGRAGPALRRLGGPGVRRLLPQGLRHGREHRLRASSTRWPTRPRSSPCASRASLRACPRTTSASA